MSKAKRPAPVRVEPVTARVIRGPRADGRFYWQGRLFRGEKGSDRTVWSGWANRDEVGPALIALIAEQGLEQPDDQDDERPIETLRDLLETWVAAQLARADLSPSWRRGAKRAGVRLCASIGDVLLEDIDRTHLERYRDGALRTETNEAGIASATVRQDFKMLRAAWAWGRELSLTPNRDLPRVGLKITPVKDKHTPSREDVLAVIAAMDEGWPRLAVRLLFATGARIGEVAQLTWGDIDLQRGRMHIRKGKTGARSVPIHAQIVDELRAWQSRERTPEPTEGIFGVTWKLIRSKLGTGPLERACEVAGVQKFTPHALRRAAVDAFRRAGVDTKTAASWLGHSDAVMLAYYAQPTDEDRLSALAVTQLGALDVDEAPEDEPEGGDRYSEPVQPEGVETKSPSQAKPGRGKWRTQEESNP